MGAGGVARSEEGDHLRADLAGSRMETGEHLEDEIFGGRRLGPELSVEIITGFDGDLPHHLEEIDRSAPPSGESHFKPLPLAPSVFEHGGRLALELLPDEA
jgi:hypothetical protein